MKIELKKTKEPRIMDAMDPETWPSPWIILPFMLVGGVFVAGAFILAVLVTAPFRVVKILRTPFRLRIRR